ncbi:hypothetical protein Q4557_10105 [Shewanella sp. 5_MG-2023]|uniref:hypothetical protein n=1 Tax=Shewanella sp. 5_MG-2023 TaxID=3062656 RepID=UPI0026E2DC7C|nr:hypothetical protein [Shewanella sp. 5_MG-2023]MDO6640308.1 hypothetical protein [Shewanella sp. 5_MG-2023]
MSFSSLFCHQGRDNGQRVLAVQLSCLIFVLIIALLFAHSVTTIIAGVVALPISALSSLRRLRDAAKPSSLVAIPTLLLLFFSLSIAFSFPVAVSVTIFILAAIVSAGFAWFSAPKSNSRNQNRRNNFYVMGYQGPHAKPVAGAQRVRQRQEPTIGHGNNTSLRAESPDAANVDSANSDIESFDNNSFDDELGHEPGYQHKTVYKESELNPFNHSANNAAGYNSETDEARYQADEKPSYRVDRGALESGSMTELLKSWLVWAQDNKKILIMAAKAIGVMCAIGLVIYLISLLFTGTEKTEIVPVETAAIEQPLASNETARVKLPDGFWLILQEDILVLRWLGDEGDAQSIWRLDTAQGDKRCAELVFNDGSKFRPISVDLMADSGTEARFSPLDNTKLINNVAMRGSFKLCGYNFSLKGSQATLSSEPAFGQFMKSL